MHYEYNSDQDLRWLKVGEELETVYPLPIQWTPATFKPISDKPGSYSPEDSDRSNSSYNNQKALTPPLQLDKAQPNGNEDSMLP